MEKLNWEKLLSSERYKADNYNQQTDFDARSEFQRDIDRIVFSSAFRRLQDKTQVMPIPQSDFVRSRLTHSIEVASVGRSLGKLIGKFVCETECLKEYTSDDFGNIVIAACLAHDIGNPPFGHTGEKAIGSFFKKLFLENTELTSRLSNAQKTDLEKFEGNAAGFRILTNEHLSGRDGGLRLTYSTLGAYSKYPKSSIITELNSSGNQINGRKSQSKFGYFQQEREIFSQIANHLGLIELSTTETINKSWCRHPLSYVLEAADSLTYLIIDFEDAYKSGFISHKTAVKLLYEIVKDTTDARCDTEDWKFIQNKDEQVGALRSKANSLIYECSELFTENYTDIMRGLFDRELPDEIPSASKLDKIKKIIEKKYYTHSNVIDIELAGFDILGGLLQLFTDIVLEFELKKKIEDPRNKRLLLKMPVQFSSPIKDTNVSLYRKLLLCSDFVSRMTDSYAMKLYSTLKGVNF